MAVIIGDVNKRIQLTSDDDTRIITNHVSNVLSELKAYELIECINPEDRKG